tara:strand:+ start:51 stop:365 length:315 start_codon:yes stop_codon:yes gene_type:complete
MDFVSIIGDVGIPAAAALGLGWLLWQLLNNIMKNLDDKLTSMEERIHARLEGQHTILVSLIDRVRSVDNEIIRQEVLLKTLLGVPQLINHDKIAKADRDDQRKD